MVVFNFQLTFPCCICWRLTASAKPKQLPGRLPIPLPHQPSEPSDAAHIATAQPLDGFARVLARGVFEEQQTWRDEGGPRDPGDPMSGAAKDEGLPWNGSAPGSAPFFWFIPERPGGNSAIYYSW